MIYEFINRLLSFLFRKKIEDRNGGVTSCLEEEEDIGKTEDERLILYYALLKYDITSFCRVSFDLEANQPKHVCCGTMHLKVHHKIHQFCT